MITISLVNIHHHTVKFKKKKFSCYENFEDLLLATSKYAIQYCYYSYHDL